jgi:pimeloyl-ACP methyl ester carboxylesterase
VPFVDLLRSPLAPERACVRVHYRDIGSGPPVLILHGGWGYDIYPFDRQIGALSASYRFIAPDRTGYGGSARLHAQPPDFHACAAAETLALADALRLDRPVLWGHSDGAVIALLAALDAPDRVAGVVVEATHYFRGKPASRAFFETMRDDPDRFGPRVASVLAREQGEEWRAWIRANGEAWLRLAARGGDLYDGRLPELRVPALVVHGARDPRTEPGELDAIHAAVPGAEIVLLPDGAHSPHSECDTAEAVTGAVARWLARLG